MSGFWSGFGDAFQKSYLQAKEQRWRSEEAEEDRLFRDTQARKKAEQARRDALISLVAKRGTMSSSARENVAKYAGDVTWVASKLGDVEGSEEYITAIQSNPQLANRIKTSIEDAAEWAAENVGKDEAQRLLNLGGEELMTMFQIAGNNPEALEPDDILSIIPEIDAADMSNDEEFLRLQQEIYGRTGSSAPTSTVIQTEPLTADVEYGDWDKQQEIVMDHISTEINRSLAEARENEDQGEASRLINLQTTLGKPEGMGLQPEVYEEFLPSILGRLIMKGDMPGLEDNPYFDEYIPLTFNTVEEYQQAAADNMVNEGEWIYIPGYKTMRAY